MINSTKEVMQILADDLKELFKDKEFPTIGGKKPLNFYLQDVPAPVNDDDEIDPAGEIVPYCLIQTLEGSFTEWNNTRTLDIAVIFCIYNADESKAGSLEVLDIVDEVYKHYMQNTTIAGNVINLPIEYTTQTDTDTYPFYFCALKLKIECNGVFLKDEELS